AGSIRTATPSLVVFNPLSWHRANGIIELPLAPGQSALAIRDSEGRPAPTQVVNSGESVLLQIPYGLAVPAFGYATYPLIDASDTPSESTLIVKSDYLENEWYQIRLNHHG